MTDPHPVLRLPIRSMDADISAAVDHNDASTMNSATEFDQLQREFNLDGIERTCFEQLVAHADARMGSAHAVVEPVGDHVPRLDAASTKASLRPTLHMKSPRRERNTALDIIESPTRLMPGGIFVMARLGGSAGTARRTVRFSCEFTQGEIQ